jgi:cytochrome c-type biogenesis protein CcmH
VRPDPAAAPIRAAAAPVRAAAPIRAAAALLAAGTVLAAGAVPAARAAEPTVRQQIESRLMCHCGCADLTVRVCTCGTADAIRAEIDSRLAAGETADQVVAAFVARHGEKILSAPTKSGFNLLAWITPFVALFAAGGVVVALIRRWERAGARRGPDGGSRTGPDAGPGGGPDARPQPGPGPGPPGEAAAPPDADLLERVRREVERER